jgi:hypothetical protein
VTAKTPMSFDTLRAAETLESVGFETNQAKAIVTTMNEAFSEQVATKADIAELKAATKAEIAELKAILTWRIVLAMGAFAALVRFLP